MTSKQPFGVMREADALRVYANQSVIQFRSRSSSAMSKLQVRQEQSALLYVAVGH